MLDAQLPAQIPALIPALFAAVPVAATVLLLLTRLPAWAPPVTGVALATVVSLLVLGEPVAGIVSAVGASWPTVVKMIAIIGAGALLSRVMHHTGAQKSIATWLSRGGTSVAAALMMSHGVVPFLETVTGFGVTIIIGLPLMIALGFAPMPAATMVLLALMVSPWGSMGPGTLLASDIAGSGLTEMGVASGVLNLPAFLVSGILVAVIAGRAGTSDAGLPRHLLWIATGTGSALLLWVSVISVNWALGTPVAGPSATALVAVFWLLIVRRGRILPGPGVSLLPYGVLVLGTMLGQILGSVVGPVLLSEILESPALWALAGAATGLALFSIGDTARTTLFTEAGSMLLQVGLPTALYVLFGMVMDGGGLATALAASLTSMGVGYLFVSPFLAALSGYITASGTGANAMFGSTQIAAARALDVSPFWMMASQNVASGWAVATSPARIEVAYRMIAATRGQDETEGPPVSRAGLLKVMVPAVLVTTVIWGVMNLVFFT